MTEMRLRVFDVEHGACAMLQPVTNGQGGRLAMIDSGCTEDWTPSAYIRHVLGRTRLDHLFITNADQDHMSDLQGLWDAGIDVGIFYRNRSYTAAEIAQIKRQGGALTRDAERYVALCDTFNGPIVEPFDQFMGGITAQCYWNPYPTFTETNDLSLAVFFEFAGVRILFPGDLERAGWLALLENPAFVASLRGTQLFVASHHGRESGFCADVFDYCTPSAVIISDKPIQHETQRMGHDYRAVVRDEGVIVRTTMERRHVLTTRRDGWIQFTVNNEGTFFVDTECGRP